MNIQSLLSLVLMGGLSAVALAHTDITVHDANQMLTADPNLLVIDVREANEYCNVGGHVPGAYNYPYNTSVIHQKYTDFDPDEPILIICRSGSRSNSAAEFLDIKGFTKVYDILGGTLAWRAEGYPTVGCVDSDKDQINDDLDNFPAVFNPTQSDILWLGDFAEMAARWHDASVSPLMLDDLTVFCQYWLKAIE